MDDQRLHRDDEPTQSWTFNRRVLIRAEREIDGALAVIAQADRFLADVDDV